MNKKHEEKYKFYLDMVKDEGLSIKYVPEYFRGEQLCLIAVNRYGRAIKYVPEEHKTPELCLLATERSGLVFRFVSDEFREYLNLKKREKRKSKNKKIIFVICCFLILATLMLLSGCGRFAEDEIIDDIAKIETINPIDRNTCVLSIINDDDYMDDISENVRKLDICDKLRR